MYPGICLILRDMMIVCDKCSLLKMTLSMQPFREAAAGEYAMLSFTPAAAFAAGQTNHLMTKITSFSFQSFFFFFSFFRRQNTFAYYLSRYKYSFSSNRIHVHFACQAGKGDEVRE